MTLDMLEQIQSQQAQIDALKSENAELRAAHQAIHKKLEALEARVLGSGH